MGGPSSEHEVSLSSGKEIVSHLDKNKYEVFEMILPRNFSIFDLDKSIKKYDLIFNALHGRFGEDGTLQAVLDNIGVKYTGSGVLASAWGMDKSKTNLIVEKFGIRIPKFVILKDKIKLEKAVDLVMSSINIPCVVKPNDGGSSVGATIVKQKFDLQNALQSSFEESDTVMVQEYIYGRELTCAVLGNKQDKKVFPVIEVVVSDEFYDYNAKYIEDTTQYICPAKIVDNVAENIKTQAYLIHDLLGCYGLTRSDFILSKTGDIYFLEINTSPGMTSHSLCPKAAKADGISYTRLLDMIIKSVL